MEWWLESKYDVAKDHDTDIEEKMEGAIWWSLERAKSSQGRGNQVLGCLIDYNFML